MSEEQKKEKKHFLPFGGAAVAKDQEKLVQQIREALISGGKKAVVITGPYGAGKTSLLKAAALGMTDHFRLSFGLDARGGLRAEEFLVRLCQFLQYNSVGDFNNVVMGHMPLSLKTDFLGEIMAKSGMLVALDEVDDILSDGAINTAGLRQTIEKFMARSGDQGGRFIFTSRTPFAPSSDSSQFITIELPEQAHNSTPQLDSLGKEELSALLDVSSFDKAIEPSEQAEKLFGMGLVEAVGEKDALKYRMPTFIREAAALKTGASGYANAMIKAAEHHEAFARKHGVLWHMLYARELFIKAGQVERTAPIVKAISPAISGWGFRDLALELNSHVAANTTGAARSEALLFMGALHNASGELAEAAASIEQAIAEDRSTGRPVTAALQALGAIKSRQGRHKDALAMFEESLLGAGSDDKATLAAWLGIGAESLNVNNKDRAVEALESAIEVAHRIKDHDSGIAARIKLGKARQKQGSPDKAEAIFKEALDMAKSLDDNASAVSARESLGELYSETGQHEKAIQQYEESLQMALKEDDKPLMAGTLQRIAAAHRAGGDIDEALKKMNYSLALYDEIKDKRSSAITLQSIGELNMDNGDHKEAIRNNIISLALLDSLGSEDREFATMNLRQIEQQIGQDEFVTLYNEIIDEFKSAGPKEGHS